MKNYQITVLDRPHYKVQLTNIKNKTEKPIILKIYQKGNRELIFDEINHIVEESLPWSNHLPYKISPKRMYFCGKMIQKWIKYPWNKKAIRIRKFIFDFEYETGMDEIVLLTNH